MLIDKDAKLITEAYNKVQESLYGNLAKEREELGIDRFEDEGKPGYWTSGYDDVTMKALINAVEKTLEKPFENYDCLVCHLGQVMDTLNEMGLNVWTDEKLSQKFNERWEEFTKQNAYAYDSYNPHNYEARYEKPEVQGKGEYLIFEGDGRGPTIRQGCEFAIQNGFKKVIVNGLS